MKTQLTKRSLIALALIAMLASSAGAVVLHDQSTIHPGWFDGSQQGFLNFLAPGPIGGAFYSMCDVTVGDPGWIIESITIYVNYFGGEYSTPEAYINIFEKDGALPLDTPVDSHAFPVVVTALGNENFSLTVSGLSIELSPGEFWIGLTPLEGGFDTSVFLPSDTLIGNATPTYDSFGGWGNWTPDTDGAILIQGIDDIPVATENLSMGSVKALFR